MANRVTGLSGMDIEGMVSSMMKVEQLKVDKLYRQKTMLTWKQEAYKGMSSALSSFQSKYLSFTNTATNFKSSALFLKKNFTVKSGSSDSSAVTVKNTSLTKNVDHKISVLQLAQSQKITGAADSSGHSKSITSEDIDVNKLKDGMNIELNLDGKKVKFELDGYEAATNGMSNDSQKMDWLVSKMNEKFAEFGAGSSSASKIDVSKNGNKLVFSTEAGRSLSVSSFSNGYTAAHTFTYASDDAGSTIEFDVNGTKISVSTLTQDGEKIDAEELAKRINDELDLTINLNSGSQKNLSVTANGNSIRFDALSQKDSYTITGSADSAGLMEDGFSKELNGKTTSEFGVASGASTDNTSAMTVGSKFGNIDFDEVKINGKSLSEILKEKSTSNMTSDEIEEMKNMSVKQMMDKINNSNLGLTVDYNAVNGTFSMESAGMGETNAFTLSQDAVDMFGFDGVVQADANGNLSAVTGAVENEVGKFTVGNGGTFNKAQDAKFVIDGLETSRESNNITIGELSLTLNEVTGRDNPVTIKSSSNNDEVIETVKDFIKSYNELLSKFTTAYSETRAKSGSYTYYEPLTDEERSAMSEKDIELWEEKAKQGILSRDGTISRVIDSLRSSMNEAMVLPDGRKISLSDIGISSTDWKDMGALTVDEDKLRKALEERPEDVAALFSQSSSEGYYGDRKVRTATSGLAYRLDDIVQDATRSTPHPTNKSYGYFTELIGSKTARITNNTMTLSLKEINEKIYNLEQLNLSKENNYYNMFSKMEQAMTKAQNQMSMAGLG